VHDNHPEAGLPWYRFFWPWFIVALLTTSVVAALVTVAIAYRNQDSLVDERYYETGNAINRRIAAEANAEELAVRATLRIDALTGEVRLELAGDLSALPERIRLELSHATVGARDAAVMLARSPGGGYYGQLDTAPDGRYYVILQPAGTAAAPGDGAPLPWRLQREIQLPSSEPSHFGATP
jgi:hypothetical protein